MERKTLLGAAWDRQKIEMTVGDTETFTRGESAQPGVDGLETRARSESSEAETVTKVRGESGTETKQRGESAK
jgi:hypothetical protein